LLGFMVVVFIIESIVDIPYIEQKGRA